MDYRTVEAFVVPEAFTVATAMAELPKLCCAELFGWECARERKIISALDHFPEFGLAQLPSCHHDTHAPRPHARPRWPGAAGFGRPGGLPVVHWGARKRQNTTWQAWQKKNPLVLNVHFTLFEDSATGDAVSRLRAQPGR